MRDERGKLKEERGKITARKQQSRQKHFWKEGGKGNFR